MDNRFILLFNKTKLDNSSNSKSQINIVNYKNNITVKNESDIKIKSIEVFDIYNFSINGLQILSLKEVNKTLESFTIDKKHKLLLIVTTLENGTIFNKKIL